MSRPGATLIANSSASSRTRAFSGVSFASTLPPGNSQSPAIGAPSGRLASSNRPRPSSRAQATTSVSWRAVAAAVPVALRLALERAVRVGLGTRTSTAVVGVDRDVVVRQIARPYGRVSRSDTDVRADDELPL